MTPPSGAVRPPSAFAPLRNPVFRGIWIANLLSNVGGWMQTAGAAWEMTSLTNQPIFVGGASGRVSEDDSPAVFSSNGRRAQIEAMKMSGVEEYDIPAFLRKQAD